MLFKSRKNILPGQNDSRSPFKEWVDGQLRRFSIQLSKKLSGMEQQLSGRQKKIIITLFSLVFGCVFILSLYKGLFAVQSAPPGFLKTPHVSVPIVPHLPDSLVARRQLPKTPMPIDTNHIKLITK
jgi:hypothetical protein